MKEMQVIQQHDLTPVELPIGDVREHPDNPRQGVPLTEAERGYLAGVIDGEGSIMAYLKTGPRCPNPTVELKFVVANTDRRLIEWLENRFPEVPSARVHTHKIRDAKKEKPVWYWAASSRKMRPILDAALPYLIVKRRQAELALELIDGYTNPGRRGLAPEVREARYELVAAIRELNRKGPM